MKPTQVLNEKSQTVRLMLKDVTSRVVAVRETEVHAGCNCDRWGHPCPGCLDRKEQAEGDANFDSSPNSEVNKWSI